MSKLTRSVIYLNESDRPKKVEPLSFSDWHRHKDGLISRSIKAISDWQDGVLNEAVREYATYLQEFSAEEVGVEFRYFLDTHKGLVDVLNNHPLRSAGTITYLGKCKSLGDTFSSNDGTYIRFYSGHLHSGKF